MLFQISPVADRAVASTPCLIIKVLGLVAHPGADMINDVFLKQDRVLVLKHGLLGT